MVFSSRALKDPEVILKGSGAVVNGGRIELAQAWKSWFESAKSRGEDVV
jgi:hypothetical protein